MSESVTKPPLGLMPRKIHAEKVRSDRIHELIQAMYRYAKDATPTPVEWVIELEELLSEYPSGGGA